jgi:hypothetical protein
MAVASTTGPAGNRSASWKRRLTIRDIAMVIALLAVDLGLLRAVFRDPFLALAPLLGLLAIMVGFVWRYVPRRWDRPCFAAALLLYLLFLGFFVAVSNPIWIAAWMGVGLIQ